jgi:hypothetical protein
MKSFIVRIYRFRRKNPRTLVGVVEEVGLKVKKAFTNVDELWEIFNSPGKGGVRLKKGEIPERRNAARIKKEIPFVFFHKKRNLDANTMNYSKNGLGIRIFKKVAFPVGDTVTLQAGDSIAKAQVKWVKKEIDPFATIAGLKLVDGSLNLKGARKNIGLTMRKETLLVVKQGEVM